jgi:hypothetical protein
MLVLLYKSYKLINLCVKCKFLFNFFDWCEICKLNHFQLNYGENPSGSNGIDQFLKDNYCESRSPEELIEWIPYNKLKDISNTDITKYGKTTYYMKNNLNLTVMLMKFENLDGLLNVNYKFEVRLL